MRICISRTDNLGDVILTLPLAGFLKQQEPKAEIFFLGKSYTEPIIKNCPDIHRFLNWDHWQSLPIDDLLKEIKSLDFDYFYHVFPNKQIAQIAKKANIKNRVGTSHRLYHWTTCNHKVFFSRKNSDLHEAQLNFKLLKPFYEIQTPTMAELATWTNLQTIPPTEIVHSYLSSKKNVIIHAKSKGSAVEWGMQNFAKLALELAEKDYHVLFTGTEFEGEMIKDMIPQHERIYNTCGQFSLTELISLIQHSHALVACSTGPLHIAAASGIKAIGLFSTKKPIHPGRWQAIGKNAITIVSDPNELPGIKKDNTDDIKKITPEMVLKSLL